jgi:hypothetical protein
LWFAVNLLLGLSLQYFNFGFERFKFVHFALQKSARQGGFLGDAAGGQDADVAEFVFRLAEVLYLDPAFVDEGIEAVVQAAGADAELAGDLALRQVGVVLQHAQHPVVGVFLQLGTAGGHGGDGSRVGSGMTSNFQIGRKCLQTARCRLRPSSCPIALR